MSIRVRFAPSPTGYLHVGGARTALFNWLFARQQKGSFILRIEDTDTKRNDAEMVDGILEGMRWLGLTWDEGPYFQSDRLELYTATTRRLIAEGHAYRDFSPPDDKSGAYRAFRDLEPAESDRRASTGESHAVRFKVPEEGTVSFEDLVFGRIEVASNTIEDFVITRSDGFPTYHLSVVADDIEMGITHVIRGADHLSNTGKHVLLFEALGKQVPLFVHLPMILGPDKKRLSKRHGATSVTEYSQMGLLPEAARNYLALLGWSPGDDAELLLGDALVDRFDISRINRADAVFDPAKLDWMNKRYISSVEAAELEPFVKEQLQAHELWNESWAGEERGRLLDIIDLLKTRVQNLFDFPVYGRAFFTDAFEYEAEASAKFLSPKDEGAAVRLKPALQALRDAYAGLQSFDLEQTEATLRRIGEEFELKAGPFIGAVRVATTGRGQAPGIFDVLVVLGRDKTLERLDRVLQCLP